jgi:phospholipid/cholesterol/gamma-HCH transport system substrate-binding protein
MDRDAKYAAVGAFVLLLAALAIWFVLWYSESADRHNYRRYEIYFQGTVTGLNEGQTVRYLGVVVGRVVHILLDPRASDRVEVIADIDGSAPINERTIASLTLQGVTGLLYIDLARDRGDRPVMPPVESQQYPVIRSVQSDFDIFVSNLPELVTQASEVANRLRSILNDKNIAAVTATLENIHKASDALPKTMKDVEQAAAELHSTVLEIRVAAAGVREVTEGAGPDVKAAIARVREVAENLAATTKHLDELMVGNKDNITRFTDEGLLELQQLIRDSRGAAIEFRELSRSLKQNPSQIIYEPPYRGVEIAR